MKKYLIIVILITITTFFSSCSLKFIGGNSTNEIVNKVTNEITNKVVESDLKYTVTDLSQILEECIAKVEDSCLGMVMKTVIENTDALGRKTVYEDPESYGSAVIYDRVEVKDEDGKLLYYTYYCFTNCHVVTCDNKADMTLPHKSYCYIEKVHKEYEVEVIGKDQVYDVATFKFNSPIYLPAVEIGDSSSLKKGTIVVNVGCPNGFDYYNSATLGIVSNTERYVSFDSDGDGVRDIVGTYIHTDAAINPGNSGGGMFTLDGKLVGIPGAKLERLDIEGMCFAVPINLAVAMRDEYFDPGIEVKRARFGITSIDIQNISLASLQSQGMSELPNIYFDEVQYGILVTQLSDEGSLVDIVKPGDIVLKFEDDKIYSSSDISKHLNNCIDYKIGDKIKVTYWDHLVKEVKEVEVELKADSSLK